MSRGGGGGAERPEDSPLDSVTREMTPEALDVLVTCIADHRRRLLIEGVGERSGPVQYEELAQFISERENGATTRTPSNEDVDRVTIELVHNHLPRLDSAGVIDVDRDDRTVRRGDRLDQALTLLGRA